MSPIPPQAYNTKVPPATSLDPEASKSVKLFQPITVKSVTLKNRIGVSPMCMYSAEDGFVNDFHLAHLLSFALRGVGLVIIEATAVEPQGRISPHDLGLWKDDHIEPLKRITDAIKSQGSVPAIQIAHAGRKASMGSPFAGYRLVPESEGGWATDVRGPSELPYDGKHATPHALTKEQIAELVQKWADAASRADKAGIEVLEIHGAHGYLIHNFLSGNSNKRTDEYGGPFENRIRFPLEVARAVRAVWPEHKPLWFRVSATDWKEPETFAKDPEGWDLDQTIKLAKALKEIGIDVIDCSSGGNLSGVKYPSEPHYQVPFAEAIKREADIETAAVGLILDPKEAEKVLEEDKADYILLGREILRNPAWTNRAAEELGVPVKWANQYERADKERWAARRDTRK
ncbi:hypothetical protein BX666DRAFT_2017657 [Dichotomocladium elegans]|nr:hypothetical protein BX666DRAFT_2017657 [Dichotomocladium elegans]